MIRTKTFTGTALAGARLTPLERQSRSPESKVNIRFIFYSMTSSESAYLSDIPPYPAF